MNTRQAAERWHETWEHGWRAHEPDEIVAPYAEGAYFQSHPFRDPQAPRDYILPTFAEEASAGASSASRSSTGTAPPSRGRRRRS
jgi:hypothetical protein